MSMNPFLADIYNTAENIGSANSDTEKLAQAQVLSEMLAGEGIDIDRLSGTTIAKVASAVFGDDSPLYKAAEEVAAEEKKEEGEGEGESAAHEEGEKKTEEEKTAEADFLGRMMAHAYVDELATIEKQAAKPSPSEIYNMMKNLTGSRLEAAKAALPGAVKSRVSEYAAAPSHLLSAITGKHPLGKLPGGKQLYARRSRLESLGEAAKKVGPEAALAGGGVTAAALALKGKKEKKASALDKLAEERAAEIYNEWQASQQTGEQKLAATVEELAWQKLREAGLAK